VTSISPEALSATAALWLLQHIFTRRDRNLANPPSGLTATTSVPSVRIGRDDHIRLAAWRRLLRDKRQSRQLKESFFSTVVVESPFAHSKAHHLPPAYWVLGTASTNLNQSVAREVGLLTAAGEIKYRAKRAQRTGPTTSRSTSRGIATL
jgi:hypothetical protein